MSNFQRTLELKLPVDFTILVARTSSLKLAETGMTGLEQQFLEHLLSGERVLWIGKPEKGGLYKGWDFLAIPIWGWVIPGSIASIYGGVYSFIKGFNIGNFWSLNSSLEALVFILGGMVFLPVGFYMAFGQFAIRKRKISRTFYAVTEKRLLMLSVKSHDQHKELQLHCQPRELYLDSIRDIDIQINPDGTGTLIFTDGKRFLLPEGKKRPAYLPKSSIMPWGYSDNTFAFSTIKGARKVYEIIEKTRRLLDCEIS